MTKSKKNANLKFEFFDVTADVGFRAYGENLEEAFQNAGLATFEVMTDTSRIKQNIKREIILESEDEKALLYDWLSELLFLHDYEGLVFSEFTVQITSKEDGKFIIKAEIWGEEFNQSIHEVRDEVKAVTFHLMEIEKNNACMVQVILDT
ncbi:MAG: archease [Methanobacteriaceae archaeon]|nr:archease [Methanobacteriaceae archaeon]